MKTAMGALTTHILDTAHGRPAVAVHIDLFAYQGAGWALLRSAQTNADGRCDAPLLQGADFVPGRYRLDGALRGALKSAPGVVMLEDA